MNRFGFLLPTMRMGKKRRKMGNKMIYKMMWHIMINNKCLNSKTRVMTLIMDHNFNPIYKILNSHHYLILINKITIISTHLLYLKIKDHLLITAMWSLHNQNLNFPIKNHYKNTLHIFILNFKIKVNKITKIPHH